MENQGTKILPPTNVGRLRVQGWSPAQWDEPEIQAVLLCASTVSLYPSISRKIEQTYDGFQNIFKDSSVFFGYVGTPINESHKGLAKPFVSVEPTLGNPGEIYRKTADAFVQVFEEFKNWNIQHIAVFSMGNAAYCPEAIKRAIEIHSTGSTIRKVSVFLLDEKYPNIGPDGFSLDADGWPQDPYYGRAYNASERISTYFLLTCSYPYNPTLLNESAPEHLSGTAVVTQPYPDSYIPEFEPSDENNHPGNLEHLKKSILTLDGFSTGDLLVPFIGSDIWSPEALRFRMTEEQRKSCHVGTTKIIQTLLEISKKTRRRVWMPITMAGATFIKKLPFNNLQVRRQPDDTLPPKSSVIVCGYEPIFQDDYIQLLGAADCTINRKGGQTESSTILTLLEKPNVVITLPENGYNQEELISMAMTLEFSVDPDGNVNFAQKLQPPGWTVQWTQSVEQIQRTLWQALFLEKDRKRRTNAALWAFRSMRNSNEEDIFSIARFITGLEKAP